MKSIVSVCFLALFALISQAQNTKAILRGGVNLANVTVSDDGNIDDAKMLTSFQVGLIGDFHLASILYVQPGIVFTGKGTKSQSGTENSASWFRATSNPYYLEVPVNFVVKSPTGPVKVFAGAGPYIAVGIAGKNKTRGAIFGSGFESEKSIEWSDDDPSTLNEEEGAGFGIMKRFDYGVNGTLGVEGRMAVLSVNYGLGLAKLQSGSNSGEDNNNKHRVLSFTLGIRL